MVAKNQSQYSHTTLQQEGDARSNTSLDFPQTYPLDLIEVVIADDDDNDDPLSMVSNLLRILDIQYVRQKDLGYRLSEVRNLGIRTAKNDYVIFTRLRYGPCANNG